MEIKNNLKVIDSVTHNGVVLNLKVNFTAIKNAFAEIGGASVLELSSKQTPENVVILLRHALVAGGNVATNEMCEEVINESPEVFANIIKTYDEMLGKLYSVSSLGNLPASTEAQA